MFIPSEIMLMPGGSMPTPERAVEVARGFGAGRVTLSLANQFSYNDVLTWSDEVRRLGKSPGVHLDTGNLVRLGLPLGGFEGHADSSYRDCIEGIPGGLVDWIRDAGEPPGPPIVQGSQPDAKVVTKKLNAFAGQTYADVWTRNVAQNVAPCRDWPILPEQKNWTAHHHRAIEARFAEWADTWDALGVPTVIGWLRFDDLRNGVRVFSRAQWSYHVCRLLKAHPHRAWSVQVWLGTRSGEINDKNYWFGHYPVAENLANHERARLAAWRRMGTMEKP